MATPINPHIDPNCKFCLQNQFAIVAENDQAVSIICDTAKNWGHSLIIPKKHSSNLFSAGMNETIWKEGMVPILRETIQKLGKNPDVIGFHINSNGGGLAEQTVFHTHIHVVPKYMKDKDEWLASFTTKYTGRGVKLVSGWEEAINHINDCVQKGILKKDENGIIESFNLVARMGERGSVLNNQEHFWIIPKSSNSNYSWNGGGPHLDFATREKIAQRINNEEWEEGNQEKPNIPKNPKPNQEPAKDNNNQQPNQNGNSNNPEPEKNEEKLPVNNQNPSISENTNPQENDNSQIPNDQSEDNNKNSDRNQPNNNENGSNGNNSDKKILSSITLNLVKKYFQKNKVKLIELDGENWIITYQDKKEKKTILVANAPDLQTLVAYLKSRGSKTFNASELENYSNTNSSNGNETRYWPWILGIGGILVLGIVVWTIRKKTKKKMK